MHPVDLEYTPLKHFSKRLAELAALNDVPEDLAAAAVWKESVKSRLVYASYAFLLVALWQAFWERIAETSFEASVGRHADPESLDAQRTQLKEALKRFNTPSATNIDRLIRLATGVPQLSNAWVLPDMSNVEIRRRLDAILHTRHRIAHTEIREGTFSRDENLDSMKLLYALAEISSDAIDAHVGKSCEADSTPITSQLENVDR